MEKALWYLIAGTRGGENRARIIRLLDERPRNANRLADELGVEYNTVRHHLDTLAEHDVVEPGGSEYAELYDTVLAGWGYRGLRSCSLTDRDDT